jgi:enolase
MEKIKTLTAREIADSRGAPTIEVTLTTERTNAVASVPSGASVGVHEANVISAKDAAAAVRGEIAAALAGKSFTQQELDAFLCKLDGTPGKARLGANAILGVSIAFARAQAQENGVPLYAYLGSLDNRSTFAIPQPLFNVLNGGKHAKHGIDVQECMLAPVGFATMEEKVRAAQACVSVLKSILEKMGCGSDMGDEGGFAPALSSNDEALEVLAAAIREAGYAGKIRMALDIAASSMPNFNKEKMSAWYVAIAKKYPLVSIEDPFGEDDFDDFAALRAALDKNICVVGDDLTVTSTARIALAAQKKAVDAVIIKPNQVGTVTEAVEAVRAARAAGWKVFASHRSGETMDPFIADFAVGLSCDYIKAGAPTRPERMAKYTRLMEIENELHAL